jgi:hypothetical protein
MIITKIKFYIDLKNIRMSNELSSNQCNFYLIADHIDFPDKNYVGLPITILRWMLKELRLLINKKNTIKERYVYFYPDHNNYLQFEMVDNVNLKITLYTRKSKKTPIINTIFSKEGKIEKTELYCKFNEFFKEVYDTSELVYDACSKEEVLSGDLFVLQAQLNYSKSLYNKIIKTL